MSENVHNVGKKSMLHVEMGSFKSDLFSRPLTLARAEGGLMQRPTSFSEMAVESLGRLRRNLAELMGHSVRNFWQKKN